MYEVILKVGKRGEIYTVKELRKKVGIKEGGKVKAVVVDGKLVIEPIPSIEDLIKSPVAEITVEEAERISEEAQKEAGIYG